MFQLLAGVLAFFYGLIPNYAAAIALLTVTVMLVLSPLTLKSTRSMLAMQKLHPELKRLQNQHRGDRQKLNEEMMRLYKEHNVNPVAGCLPMLLQLPVFIVMYQVIQGLTRRGEGGQFDPKYLDRATELYQALVEAGGKMVSFGVDLAKSASDGHGSFFSALPYFVIVALVVATQYLQTRQSMVRNPAASANPQQKLLLRVMPAFFGLISLSIPAGVNVYFLVSALFRIAQTAAMYRFDPALSAHAKRHAKEVDAKAVDAKAKAIDRAKDKRKGSDAPKANGAERAPGTKHPSARASASQAGRATQKGTTRPSANRSRKKRAKKAR